MATPGIPASRGGRPARGAAGAAANAELALLQRKFREQEQAYQQFAAQVGQLRGITRLLVQAWLAEIRLMMAQLERRLQQLTASSNRAGMDAAWRRFWNVLSALSPGDLQSVGRRLLVVSLFLLLQIAAGIGLLGYSVRLFGRFDPQTALTREQWEERGHARAEVRRVQIVMARAAEETKQLPPASPVPGPQQEGGQAASAVAAPDTSLLRGEVEALASTLSEMRLPERDLRLANSWLENVLGDLNKEPADLADAAKILTELETALATSAEPPPAPVALIVLGSLLGMITITIHLNWKFRSRWNTLGFMPWYVTKLVGAPVISLAVVGLLFQVSFTADLAAATDISALGLRGASPLLIFAVSIITGLFSNKMFEWLRGLAGARVATMRPPAPAATASNGGGESEDNSSGRPTP